MECKEICKHTPQLKTIGLVNAERTVDCYAMCKASSVRAAARQCAQVRHPRFNTDYPTVYENLKRYQPHMFDRYLTADLKQFTEFADRIYQDEIKPLLTDFTVNTQDVIDWFNHLSRKQQTELFPQGTVESVSYAILNNQVTFDLETITDKVTMPKLEAQDFGHPDDFDIMSLTSKFSKYPKTRCISMPCSSKEKYVMGPLVWKLESIFKKNVPGYSSGLSYKDLEDRFAIYEKKGFNMSIASDQSAMDAHRNPLKCWYSERQLYFDLMEEGKINHVPQDVFDTVALGVWNKLYCSYRNKDGKATNLGYAEIPGRTYSGENHTSFANTYTTWIITRFIFEVLLKMDRSEYDFDAAGDDNNAVTYEGIRTEKEIKDAHDQAAKLLGCWFKMVDIGGLYDSDFCSTHVFKCPECGPKIIRQLPRFLTLTPYSRNILKLSNDQAQNYIQDLKIANSMWIGELDIFKQYNDRLKADGEGIILTEQKYTKSISKNKLFIPGGNIKEETVISKLNKRMRLIDPSWEYRAETRVSEKKNCCNKAFREHYLGRKYGLSHEAIEGIIHEIKTAPDFAQLSFDTMLGLF